MRKHTSRPDSIHTTWEKLDCQGIIASRELYSHHSTPKKNSIVGKSHNISSDVVTW